MKSSGLGRGLGSLIPEKKLTLPDAAATSDLLAQGGTLLQVAPKDIVENPRQPRSHFSPSELEDLIASIRQFGILLPLVATALPQGGYQLIAGERRLRAARALGLETVPLIVRSASEQEKLELALIENIQREDLNPAEEARAYRSLMDGFGLTQEEVAKRVGKSRSSLANTVRLLDLPDEMVAALERGELLRSQARGLLALHDPIERQKLFERILAGEVTVHEVEEAAPLHRKRERRLAARPAHVIVWERQLEMALRTKVRIDAKPDGAGRILISFFGADDLNVIMQALQPSLAPATSTEPPQHML
jgi:ParB family chromosome partitioning protein